MFRGRQAIAVTVAAGVVAAATITSVASGGPKAAGYNTSQAPMVTLLAGAPSGSSADAIISVGDTMPGGFTFESIPDGVSVYPRGNGRADVFVNHETSTVPFPYNAPFGGATPEANQNDYTNSEVSQLNFNQQSGGVNHASKAISTLENFQRFCSNFLASAAEGFKQPIFFTNEEAQDWVFRSGTAWPGPASITPGSAGAEQAGVVVAQDVKNGKTKPIYGMGRFNHENSVAIPGFDELVVLSGDDTFQTNPPASSQLYMYTATDDDELLADEGTLHAFVADGPTTTTSTSSRARRSAGTSSRSGEHRQGQGPIDGHELTQAVDFTATPRLPAHRRCLRTGRSGSSTSGATRPIHRACRTTSSTSSASRTSPTTSGRASPTSSTSPIPDGRPGERANPLSVSTNGRIYKLVLDPNGTGDPTEAEISILVQGDDVGTAAWGTRRRSTRSTSRTTSRRPKQETCSSRRTRAGTISTASRLVPERRRRESGRCRSGQQIPDAAKTPLLAVDQSLDENTNPALGKVDVDAASAGRLGGWESSGIVDASAAFGAGAFFLTIQAHSYWIDKLAGPDVLNAPNGPDYFFKKEGGQLIRLNLPGI